jgi:putative flippase GtrA
MLPYKQHLCIEVEYMHRLLKVDFVRFCLVGATGFVINYILLTLLYKILGLPIFIAQLIAGEIALFSNFLLHHNWTYKHKKITKTIPKLLWQFHVTSWVAIVGSALLVSIGVKVLHLPYFVALVITSVVALGWNFVWSKYVIWHHKHQEVTEEI